MNLPVEPFFVSPYKEESGGVDFLGLRQVNLALMDHFLPGINNVTYSLRPYSMMCWIAWGFKNAAQSAGLKELSRSQFDQFREKVEVLFNWSHQLTHSGTGMVGNAQVSPAVTEKGDIPLKFVDWKRNVSWFDAVNYGPSVKTDNGLGFLTQPLPGIYALTPAGEQLAIALDKLLKTYSSYSVLYDLFTSHASSADALNLFEAWRIDAPSIQEAEIYRNALFDESSIGEDTRLGQRSTSIKLILRALDAMAKPATTNDLREFMAKSQLFGQAPTAAEEPLVKMHTVWRVLQIRQAQRLAFEVLFGWVECQVMAFGRTHSSELVNDLINAFNKMRPDLNLEGWANNYLSSIKSKRSETSDLFAAAIHHEEVDIFTRISALSDKNGKDGDASAVLAIELLMLCAAYADEFLQDKYAAFYALEGGAARISQGFWAKFVESNIALPFSAFFTKVIEVFILSQHFGVAAARYSEGKQRLRLTIEERGLVSMLNSLKETWRPAVTPDRLDAMLSLMVDARLLSASVTSGKRLYSVDTAFM